MRSVIKKAATAALALLLGFTSATVGSGSVKAYASSFGFINETNEAYAKYDRDRVRQADSALVLVYGPEFITVEAGKTYDVVQRFMVTEGTQNYTNPVFICKSEDRMVTFSPVTVKRYSEASITTDIRLRYNAAVEVSYSITVSPLAKVGKLEYGITAYDSKPISYDESMNASYANTGAFKIGLDVVTASSAPLFTLETYPKFTGTAGTYFDIPISMVNTGELDAYDVYVSIGGKDCLIAADLPMKQKMQNTKAGGKIEATFRFLVDADAKSETFNLPITVSCRDYSGASYSDSSYYVIVTIKGKEEFTKPSSFIVKNVKQSPEKPKGGEPVTITFDLENNGDTDFRDVKIYLGNVASTGFEPMDSNPYLMVGDLDARSTKNMTLTYMCGKGIYAGTNQLNLKFTAIDKKGGSIEGETGVYILNVIPSKSGSDTGAVSKPKLMVTDFGADKDEILAADKFEFKFKIKNTNDETVARNIKVKVTSQSFSVTAGSNTFFISDILPGEEAEISINLKASSTLQTGAYPINISMEYEYDAEVKNNENGNSVSATDEILLQVSELLRAQCENVNIGDWDQPQVGMTCPLSFEFYNMGRSTLNNVYVTVEGDFELATGNSHYIGNIGPGSPEFVECTVRPLVSGEAECIFVIHLEDSNGDEVTRINSKTVYVSEGNNGGGMDFPGGFDIPGTDVPGMEDPGVENGEKKGVNKVVVAVIAVAVLAAAGAVFFVVRKNKNKKNDDEFDD